ncbi:unnamed protein product [Brachionus calyciflorus]|uniref:Uncharacterized protein n=1 Tax=Brachionus calyciflorus TaxID=104777 RepID=A0A814GI37_9BILA|nr:unnamed protein product [Brachionus calyciflorus]
MFRLVILFLIDSVYSLSDPRCPFQSCDSIYTQYKTCRITCIDHNFPDRGNTVTQIEEIHFKNFKNIPSYAFSDLEIQRMYLACQSLEQIDKNTFQNITSLNYLYLNGIANLSLFSNGQLSPLKKMTSSLNIERSNLNNETLFTFLESIRSWSRLYSLSLTNNNLSNFRFNFTQGFSGLTKLQLSNNQIEHFNIESYKIAYLYLDSNRIKSLSSIMFEQIPNLIHFDLSNNQIEKFELKFKMNSLMNLVLTGNRIKILENRTFEYVAKLEDLYLSNNLITQIENGTFCILDKLTYLVLSSNSLNSVNLNCLETIYYLELQNSNLSGLVTQARLGNPQNLFYLDLGYNKIDFLDLDEMKNLKSLFLNGNYLKNLSNKTLQAIPNVRTLSLKQNFLSEIKTQDFESNKHLTELNLGYNQIEEVQFPELDNLGILDLSFNKLSEVKRFTFNNLKILRELFLHSNLITKIASKSFEKNTNLKVLLLNNNSLTTIPDISKLSNLSNLDLRSNRIRSLSNNAFERALNEANQSNSRISINLLGNNISIFSSKTFCSKYTYSLGFEGIEIWLDSIDQMNICLLKQIVSDDSKIYSNSKINCTYKAFGKYLNISLIENYPNSTVCQNDSIDFEECSKLSNFKCPKEADIIRHTTWITGDPHVYSYKNKYELCTLGSQVICFQYRNYTLLCTDEQVGQSATALTELKFIYTNENASNITYTANKTHFPKYFDNYKQKIDGIGNDSLVELINYFNGTKIFYINESKTHIFISRYDVYYSVTVRATHETYSESTGVLYEGCGSIKNERVKRNSLPKNLIDTCESECNKINFTIVDENMPEGVIKEACSFDCTNWEADKAIKMINNSVSLMKVVNQSDNVRYGLPLLFDLETTTRDPNSPNSVSKILKNSLIQFNFMILFIFYFISKF